MLSIVVLGAAAGGGLPQWNCGCANCRAARADRPELQSNQASIAFSVDQKHWFLVNASPDLRQQITDTACLHPKAGALRHSPISGVILTNGEVDAIAGLLTMREGSPFNLYGHRRVLDLLEANPIFNVVKRDLVPRIAITPGISFEPTLLDGSLSGIEVEPFVTPGKTALFMEDSAENEDGDTIGLEIREKSNGKRFIFLAACAEVTPAIADRLRGAPMVFFDGTLWQDDELIALGLGQKTGQRMGHTDMQSAMAALDGLGIGRKHFLHINNSNPAFAPGSTERAKAEANGWVVPVDGMEFSL